MENSKREHHYWIMYIRINLDIIFYFKQRTLNCGSKFAHKRYAFFIHENKILNMIDMAFRKDWQWLLVIEFGIGIVIGIQTLSFTQYKLPSLLKQ